MTASTSSSIRWRPRSRRAASSCGWSRAATKYWPRARPTPADKRCSKPAWRAGRAALRRRSWPRPNSAGDFAFLSLKTPAFDLTDRGVGGRPAPNGLDAFVYAERGVYRSGETAYITGLLRDAQGAAALGVPLTFVVQRPDGVEFRRTVVADQGVGGHALTLALPGSAPSGTWHVQAFTDPKRPSGRRNDIPGRGLRARSNRVRSHFVLGPHLAKEPGPGRGLRALPLWRARHGPRSRRQHDDRGGQGARPALPAISSASTMSRSSPSSRRWKTCRRPTPTARRRSRSLSTNCRPPPIRCRRRSPCAWQSPAAAPSSAR